MTGIPTSGIVLEWARNFRGLSRDEAAERLGIPVDDLVAFETDRKLPTKGIFDDMATKYRLPTATLFMRTPPKEPKPPTDFRSLDGTPIKKRGFDYSVALSNVRSLVFLAEGIAADDEDFIPPQLPKIELSDDAEAAGERERRRLNVSVDTQLGWLDAGDAFRHWRNHAESQGVLVFQQKFPLREGRGFSLFDSPNTPVAVINKDESADTAKCFTVWHEYCHLLLRRPGISDEGDSAVEAFCNSFSAAFLVPTEALRRLIVIWPNEPTEWADGQVSGWARDLKVSRYALALRLEHKGLAPSGFALRYKGSRSNPRTPGKGDGVKTRLSELGSSYLGRVVAAYDRSAIDEVRVVEAVGLSAERIGAVREYVKRASERVRGS